MCATFVGPKPQPSILRRLCFFSPDLIQVSAAASAEFVSFFSLRHRTYSDSIWIPLLLSVAIYYVCVLYASSGASNNLLKLAKKSKS